MARLVSADCDAKTVGLIFDYDEDTEDEFILFIRKRLGTKVEIDELLGFIKELNVG